MREHPIPTDITNYRFHIIGTMTLKQFGEVALGVIVAFLLYMTNLPVVVKWPLIIFSVGLGGAAAFIPIAERPLDHWIVTFYKALYKPTQFFWKRTERIPEPFLFKPRDNEKPQEEELDLTPYKRQRIKEYLHSVPSETPYSPSFTEDETARMQSILDSFSTTPVTSTSSTPIRENAVKPTLSVRVRDIRAPESNDLTTPILSQAAPTTAILPQATEESPISPAALFETSELLPDQEQSASKRLIDQTPQVSTPSELNQTHQDHTIIHSTQDTKTNTPTVEIAADEIIQVAAPSRTSSQSRHIPESTTNDDDLSLFPDLPTEPNKIVGIVVTQNNELIPEAIIEVKNDRGEVQRAVKTNALGQFFITTPLMDGDYTITIEKEDFVFEPYQIQLSGQVVRPIKIQSL